MNIRKSRGLIRAGLVGAVLLLLSACTTGWLSNYDIEINGDNSFIDSMGNKFVVDQPYERVITLYSAHTENAFTFGGGSQIIGASTTSIFPPEAALLPHYDYRSDPEPLIAAAPDLVIIRPFINRNYNDYVRAIEKAGIPVVSLYPKDSDSFEAYVQALAMLFGKSNEADLELTRLKEALELIESQTSTVASEERVTAYFESTKTAYRTVTVDSNPARAIALAGGINIAKDVKPITKGSTIAEFGIERLMINAQEIDIFVSQRGAMNSGGSLISIPQREGFKAIKAVANEKILELNEKLISSPTFRYDKGVSEMARMFYPELMDDVTAYDTLEPISREAYASLSVKMMHTPIFVPSSSHYYEKAHKVHTYGMFLDVLWNEEGFDEIETAVLSSYIRELSDENGQAYFDREGLVTRADIAYTLYIIGDIKSSPTSLSIKDLELCMDQKIVQKIVDKGYMVLDSKGNFNPDEPVSGKKAIELLSQVIK